VTPVAARICPWFKGKTAALSLRFDDAHPTHIEKAVPMLAEHGLIGTFLITPGSAGYALHKTAWERAVIQEGHELGNHTLHHRGARTDREAEAEIGGCARLIRSLQERSTLLPFHPGGRTVWLQRAPLASFLVKYSLFLPSASMSCTEAYPGFSDERFTERLTRTVARGEWMQCHFHGIDAGPLFISTPVFRRILEHARARQDEIWQAGMAAIFKYQQERDHATLAVSADGDDALALHLSCATPPDRYDHPLTLEVVLPSRDDIPTVLDAAGNHIAVRSASLRGCRGVRFDVRPADGIYIVRAGGIGATYRRDHSAALGSAADRLHTDSRMEPESRAAQSLATVPSDIDHAAVGSRGEDPSGFRVIFNGGRTGPNCVSDPHRFSLYARGRPLIVDLFDAHQLWRHRKQHRHASDVFETAWFARLVVDASPTSEPSNLPTVIRELMYLRHASPADPPEYFVVFENVEGATPMRTDRYLTTYGEVNISGNRIAVVQDEVAADVCVLAPEAFVHEIYEKGSERMATAARVLTVLTLQPAARAAPHLLFVVIPHAASASVASAVTAVRESNALGARIVHGAVEDLAMFALDQPEIEAAGVTAVGRSCFVRRSAGRVTAATLHNGQRVSADGVLLFETDSCGDAALTIGDKEVAATLDIYDGTMIRLHADAAPLKVLVDGHPRSFDYDRDRRCVRLECEAAHDVRVMLR
jgi:hypothetical protein